MMKKTLSCLAMNRPGVLAKIASVFAEQGINIYSLAAGEIEEEDKSRMTIVVEGDERTVREAEQHLARVPEVIGLEDFGTGGLIAMELLLIKVRLRPRSIPQVLQIAELFNAQVIAVSDRAMVLALPSEEKRINGLVRLLKPIGIIEMSRSGQIAVTSPEEET
jgi:acetolactate synthase-1/3 small subunit